MSPVAKVIINMLYKGLEHLGRYYSEYRGYVVDNEDPEGMQRLQLVIPGIADNPMDEWVWGTGQFSGQGYGCQILPQKGDMVFVVFEFGNPNKPLWKHGHFGANEIPKELRNPKIYWFKTPGEILVELDDEKKEIRITDSFKNKITMKKDGIDIAAQNNKLQPGTLGNITEKILTSQSKGIMGALSGIKSISKSVTGTMQKLALASTPVGLVAAVASEVPTLVKNLSDNDKIMDDANKSMTDTLKEVPKIKSTKVKINE